MVCKDCDSIEYLDTYTLYSKSGLEYVDYQNVLLCDRCVESLITHEFMLCCVESDGFVNFWVDEYGVIGHYNEPNEITLNIKRDYSYL